MIRLLLGDNREVLKTLPDNSVQCVVTSPPYYGLRDYGTATWEGGDPNCGHWVAGDGEPGQTHAGEKQQTNHGSMRVAKGTCPHCGAARIDNQIGLEQTPDEYVAQLVAVFREVRRVLKDDGTLWLNLGDSYCTTPKGNRGSGINGTRFGSDEPTYDKSNIPGLKHKDLIGIPWRVAFALQADGWWLRQDIIWAKPNPMPESVTDRCTKAHEYIFLLTKSARYFYDNEAVKEPQSENTHLRYSKDVEMGLIPPPPARTGSKELERPGYENWREYAPKTILENGRNRRSVWTVSTTPYKGAHFATFPPKLIEPCILAGSRPGDVVLDPFNGSGTTGQVAIQNGRDYIGIELNPEYIELTKKRLSGLDVRLI